jgi:glycosyltransferase involved in cell wall biosynthesis
MKRQPKTISIVTPSYNQGEFIDETIRSVLSQEGDFYLDYIVMDGGSTDESPEIIRAYADLVREGKWPARCRGITYRWVSERDGGQVDALEKGFLLAEGEIGAWLNSDDLYHDARVLSRVAAEFERDERIEIVTGDGLLVDRQGREFAAHRAERIDLNELLYLDYPILQPATFVRKRIYKAEPLDRSYACCFDAEYFVRLIRKGYVWSKVADTLAHFRLYPETKTLSGYERRFRESMAIARMYGTNKPYYLVSAVYKYVDMVLLGRYPRNFAVNVARQVARRLAYGIIR